MTSVSTTQTIIDTEYVTLKCYPEHKLARHEFHKFIHGEEFRNVLRTGLDIIKQYGITKWLSDDRNNSALPTEDLHWSMEYWLPHAFNLGWRYWAIIMPDKIAGQLSMNRLLKMVIDKGMVIQVFEDADEAMQWLESV